MKTLLPRIAAVLVALTFAVNAYAGAIISSVDITLHEDGTGTINGFLGTTPLSSSLQPDPGPGGLSSALTFDLANPPGLTAGDLLLIDPITLALSDIIRFNPTSSTSGNAVFYSMADGQLADTGFPTANYANTFSLTENVLGPTTYTPLVGQPGFVTGAEVPVTYFIYSDEIAGAVPEFANTGFLLAFSLMAVFLFARTTSRVERVV